MPKKKKFTDPYFEKEQNKYENPIPSRQSIIDYLNQVDRAVSLKHLIGVMELEDEAQQDALFYRLKAMLRDGQLMKDRRNRYSTLKRLKITQGKVMGHPDGFGFVIPDEGGDDIFLSAKEMRQTMHGDVVKVFEVGRDRRGRREGRIHQIVSRGHENIVGRFFCERGVCFVEPDNKRLTHPIVIAQEDTGGASQGQIVLVQILSYPSKHHPALGQVMEILGDHLAPGLEIDVAIHSHHLPNEWPQAVLDEVAKIPLQVRQSDIEGRRDLRDLPFVTIDGEDARDFDDAVFCRPRKGGGWHLFVAIADVSFYVKPGSALDKEAQKRSTSVYFPGRVIPMLPEQLSNGLCSLNPKVDRLCLVCEMSLSPEGKVTRSRFFRAVIHSQARLTYTQVAAYIGKQREHAVSDERLPANVIPSVEQLYQVYLVLAKQRRARGAIEFETTETKIEFDENKKISKIVPLIRNDAHRLIEECMLAANVTAAKLVKREKIPALFRVHEVPTEAKLETLRAFLNGFGLQLPGGKKPQPKDFAKMLLEIEDRPEKGLIETVMLRSLTQARYMEKNGGHFGLAYSAYAHFTSPIRRYPDLLTHRAIVHVVEKQDVASFAYTKNAMAELGQQASFCERRADEASRDVMNWLKCEFMLDKLGEVYQGTISAVTSFGVFVMLDDYFVEGLVPMTSLQGDYFQYDPSGMRLIGENTRRQYRLGDKLVVQVARVDLDERKIDFELIADEK